MSTPRGSTARPCAGRAIPVGRRPGQRRRIRDRDRDMGGARRLRWPHHQLHRHPELHGRRDRARGRNLDGHVLHLPGPHAWASPTASRCGRSVPAASRRDASTHPPSPRRGPRGTHERLVTGGAGLGRRRLLDTRDQRRGRRRHRSPLPPLPRTPRPGRARPPGATLVRGDRTWPTEPPTRSRDRQQRRGSGRLGADRRPSTPVDYVPSGSAAPGAPASVTASPATAARSCPGLRRRATARQQITSYTRLVRAPNGMHLHRAVRRPASCPGWRTPPRTRSACGRTTGLDGLDRRGSPHAVSRRANSTPTPPPAPADPWTAGQYVDFTNTSGSVARLGGYGLWNAQSSRSTTTAALRTARPSSSTPRRPSAPVRPCGSTSGGAAVGAALLRRRPAALRGRGDRPERRHRLRRAGQPERVADRVSKQVRRLLRQGADDVRSVLAGRGHRPLDSRRRHRHWGAPISGVAWPSAATPRLPTTPPSVATPSPAARAGGGDRSCAIPASMGSKYFVEVVASEHRGPPVPRGGSRPPRRRCPAHPAA